MVDEEFQESLRICALHARWLRKLSMNIDDLGMSKLMYASSKDMESLIQLVRTYDKNIRESIRLWRKTVNELDEMKRKSGEEVRYDPS